MKVSIAGGEPTTLATDEGDPVALAVDETSVYWVTANGDVKKAKKDGS
jgi:hypothetical protein